MSPTHTLISVEEYLHTSYRPDRDYVNGQVLERNMGEKPHSRLQGFFNRFFATYEDELNFEVLPEQRLQTQINHFRIPDVMLVTLPNPDPLIVYTPPLLCIEILSSDDRMRDIRERIAEYAHMGCPASWVIDPWRRTAYTAASDGLLREVGPHLGQPNLTVPNTPITLAVEAIFAELDRLERRSTAPATTPDAPPSRG